MKVLKTILLIIILLSFILVGSPIDYIGFELNVGIILIGIIFGIYKIIKKEKIINSKIDLLILIFYITPIIPIMFNTCSSLEETLIALIKNISLFNIYCFVKELLIKDSKSENFLINLLIAGGLILVILGIDELLSRNILRYLIRIGIPNIFNKERRMFSSIGYANSFAIIMGIEIFLSFRGLKKGKIIYSGLIYLFLFSLWSSYSRAVILIFAILFLLYLICVKNKKVYFTYIIAINLIVVLLSSKLFEIFALNKQKMLVLITIAVSFIISIMFNIIIRKNYRKLCRIKTKTYIKLLIVLIVSTLLIYVVGKELDRPLKIFEAEQRNNQVRHKLEHVESSKKYNFTFDITANTTAKENNENYVITIEEENKYYDTIAKHEIQFGNFIGKKEINLETKQETVAIVIYFDSKTTKIQNGLTINSLYINGEKRALNYLYLPTKLVERIESFNLGQKSVWERQVYFKDGLKIIKSNLLFGLGDKGWMHNYQEIQSYVYSSREVHSFILQVFIDNGIVAAISLVAICIYACIQILKRRKKIRETDFAFILLTLHSMIDFNMSFYVIMIVWIILLTLVIKERNILENTDEKQTKLKLIMRILIFIIISISMIFIIFLPNKVRKASRSNINSITKLIYEEKYNQVVEEIKKFSKYKEYKGEIYNILPELDYSKITTENLQYIYEIFKNQKIVANTPQNITKNKIIETILDKISNEEMKEKFADIIISENEQMINNIKDRERNRLSPESIERLLIEQENIYNRAIKNEIIKFNN